MAALCLEKHELRLSVAGAASAGTAVNGAITNLTGYDGCVFVASIATANAGNYMKLQAGNLADGSDMADVAGSKVVADANGSAVAIEVNRLGYTYARAVLIRAGANTATGDMYSIKYNAGVQPVTNNVTNTHKVVSLQSPALGTP